MKSVFLASNAASSGKLVVTVGLALKLKEKGYKIGYLKPAGRTPVSRDDEWYDADALFVNDALGLKEPAEKVSPLVFSDEIMEALLTGRMTDAREQVTDAYKDFRKKDYVLIGGGIDIFDGTILGIGVLDLVDEMDARVLVIEPWRGMPTIDTLLGAARLFGGKCIGGIINKVPENLMGYVKDTVRKYLEGAGIKVLGIFPKDKLLESLTVRRITEALNGDVLCGERGLDEFVENFLIGAMDAESAIKYFSRVPNKAVITGAHRTDIQLAALETSTKCIILTGGLRTSDMILGQAISKGVPIISAPDDTFTTVDRIELALKQTTIREQGKVTRAKEIIDKGLDLDGLLAGLA